MVNRSLHVGREFFVTFTRALISLAVMTSSIVNADALDNHSQLSSSAARSGSRESTASSSRANSGPKSTPQIKQLRGMAPPNTQMRSGQSK
jgi:hypothetical protein